MTLTDSLSSLIQLHSKRLGVDLKWTGNGNDDLVALVTDCSNKTILSRELWDGLKDLWSMEETKGLPEPIYAKLSAIILAARARTDLSLMKRNQKAEKLSVGPIVGGAA